MHDPLDTIIGALQADPNLSPAFKRGVGTLLRPRPTLLQQSINTLRRRLDALYVCAAATEPYPDRLSPEYLRELAKAASELASAFNEPFLDIANLGGIPDKEYVGIVSEAIDGNLSFELRDKADRIEEEGLETY